MCDWHLLLIGFCTQSSAENWPTKPIRAIVPYSSGSATDIIPRAVFAQVEKQMGQSIIVENRPGAQARSPLQRSPSLIPMDTRSWSASSAFTTVPLTVANVPYDPLRDFSAVIPLANMANVLVISPAKGIKTVGEFVTAAEAGLDR